MCPAVRPPAGHRHLRYVRAVDRIYFSRPYLAGMEYTNINASLATTSWHGDGDFTQRATEWLLERTQARGALLTTSCTHALELAAILLRLGPGDEVIVPSFTFSATATAIASRGATPVFVDIEPRTMNLDPGCVEAAVTERTKAIFVVHYAGVACDLDAVQSIADKHGLAIVEDNAHGIGAYLRGQHLGTFGTFGTQSWHDTKNVTSGEGGALLVNDLQYLERAEIVREKGTNRAVFLRGQVDKYTWVDEGSSYLPSDLLAALLLAQFQRFEEIQDRRQYVWQAYAEGLPQWADNQGVELMHVPADRDQPAHMFYVMMPSHADQGGLIGHLRKEEIIATFHYQPLDSAPAGVRLGRTPEPCTVTADRASRLVRLPLHAGMSKADTTRVLEAVSSYRTHA